jgi:hypothetical protein
LDLGIIAIWFHDTDNYKAFYPDFLKALQGIKVSNKPRKGGYNKICVIDNTIILKLCSLHMAIEGYESEMYEFHLKIKEMCTK